MSICGILLLQGVEQSLELAVVFMDGPLEMRNLPLEIVLAGINHAVFFNGDAVFDRRWIPADRARQGSPANAR